MAAYYNPVVGCNAELDKPRPLRRSHRGVDDILRADSIIGA